jgi:hypothetical protein
MHRNRSLLGIATGITDHDTRSDPLKSAGEDYLGVFNTHLVPNSASTIDFPHENGAGL